MALTFQPLRPHSISFYLGSMDISVQFNHQPDGGAIKVDDEGANWVLSAEFVSAEVAAAQYGPQLLFGGSLNLAQLAGLLAGF